MHMVQHYANEAERVAQHLCKTCSTLFYFILFYFGAKWQNQSPTTAGDVGVDEVDSSSPRRCRRYTIDPLKYQNILRGL